MRCFLLLAGFWFMFVASGCGAGNADASKSGSGQAASGKSSEATEGKSKNLKLSETASAVVRPLPAAPQAIVMEVAPQTHSGRMPSEIARQAFLAVVRDEFDVGVRDAALGESVPSGVSSEAIVQIEVELRASPSNGTLTYLVTPKSEDRSFEGVRRLAIETPGKISPVVQMWNEGEAQVGLETTLAAVVKACDELPGFFEALSFPKRKQNGTEIGDIALRLREMSPAAQFEAVRSAHALPASAEKDRLLAAGYANLSLLTRHLWSPQTKVFAARALVYAEKASRAEPGPASDEAWIYAAALVGLHSAALERAEKLAADQTPRVKVAVEYCRFRVEALLELADKHPEVSESAAVLACLAAEPFDAEELTAETYGRAAEAAPMAFPIYESVGKSRQIGLLHDLTVREPAHLTQTLPHRLRATQGLPEAIQEVLSGESVLTSKLASTLEAAGTKEDLDVEPTWTVLGRLLQNEALMAADRRFFLLTTGLGVPVDSEYPGYVEMVGDHPYDDIVLGIYGSHPRDEAKQELIESLSNRDVDTDGGAWHLNDYFGPRYTPIVSKLRTLGLTEFEMQQVFSRLIGNIDRTQDDLHQMASLRTSVGLEVGFEASVLKHLEEVSPYDPLRIVESLRLEKDWSEEKLASWEEKLADRPELLFSLAATHSELGRNDDAVRVMERTTELMPSYKSYSWLAQMKQRAGDDEGYVDALKKSLEYPNYGLGASNARIRIADHYMKQKDFKSAEPYAREAAESYSARSLVCAIDCYLGLKDFDSMDLWGERLAERYPGWNSIFWHFARRHAGLPEDARAKAYADANHSAMERPTDQQSLSDMGFLSYYRAIENRDAEAGDLREALARRDENPASAIPAAAYLIRAGQRERAMQLLSDAREWTTLSEKAPRAARRAGLYYEALKEGRPLTDDVAAQLVEAIETFDDWERIGGRAHYGELMVLLGNRDVGLKLLREAAEAPVDHIEDQAHSFHFQTRTEAAVWLREHLEEDGVDENPQREKGTDSPDV